MRLASTASQAVTSLCVRAIVQRVNWSTALSDPSALRTAGLFVAEGRLVLERVLAGAAGGADTVVSVLAAPAAVRALDLDARLPGRVTVSTPAEFASLTGFNFHRGVLALVRRPAPRTLVDVIAAVVPPPMDAAEGRPFHADRNSPPGTPNPVPGAHPVPGTPNPAPGTYPVPGTRYPVFVVAEHLVDVDNVGSCFRNARGFGAAAVLLDERCPDPLYRKAIRTSLGAVLEVPWAQSPIDDVLRTLREHDIVTVGLSPRGSPTSSAVEHLDAVSARLDRCRPVAILVGNEGGGLTDATMRACTHLASIPMSPGADSLNVSTALAVALYELTTKG